VEFESPVNSVEGLGSVFVYLLDPRDQPICFWRGEAADFMDPDPQYRWHPLTANQALGLVEEAHEAGMIQFKLSLDMITLPDLVDGQLQHGDPEKPGEWKQSLKQYPAWRERPPVRLNSHKVRCYIYQCKDLPSADSDGSADPYISVYNPNGAGLRTRTIEDNLNPIFYDVVEVHYDLLSLEACPPIVLDVWDTDVGFFDGTDDFLGRAVVYLNEAAVVDPVRHPDADLDKPPQPKWHDLRVGSDPNLPTCGQVLCSFAVVEADYRFAKPYKLVRLADEVKTAEFKLDLNVLGLRELESFGLLPVKKAFVKFNTKSMLPPEKAQVVENVRTEPKDPGPSPNINTTISLTADLPVEQLFCPKLACEVFDHLCKGLSQPKLGSFTIDIGAIMHEQVGARRTLLERGQRCLDFLESLPGALPRAGAGRSQFGGPVGQARTGAVAR